MHEQRRLRLAPLLLIALTLAAGAAQAAPDLTCSIAAKPDAKTGKVKLTVTLRNDGDLVATNTSFSTPLPLEFAFAYANLAAEPTISDSPTEGIALAAIGNQQEVSYEYTELLGPGTFTAWAWVNADFGQSLGRPVPNEVNFGNNTCSVQYTIGDPPPKSADLIVTGLTGSPVEGGGPFDVAFGVTVENQGDDIATSFDVEIYVGYSSEPDYTTIDFSTIHCTFPDLDPGVSKTLPCASYNGWTESSIGQQNVYAFADKADTMNEYDRSNNSFAGSVTVTGPPDLAATKLDISSDTTTVAYSATVQNKGGKVATGIDVCLYYNLTEAPAEGTPPDQVKTVDVAPGQIVPVQFTLKGGPGGDNLVAWIVADCGASNPTIVEIREDNNTVSTTYSYVGVPNAPPVLEIVSAPTSCVESTPCVFDIKATDDADPPNFTFKVTDGPIGFYADPITGKLAWVPPLGSSRKAVSATIRVTDAAAAFDEETVTFDVKPSPTFDGVVGTVASMPTTTSAPCPLIELPGLGFAYVDRDLKEIRLFAQISNALSKSGPYRMLPLAPKYNAAKAFWSCHLAAYPGGGFVALETFTHTAVLLGPGLTQAPIRKIVLPVTSQDDLYSETFTLADPTTLVFLRLNGVQSAVVFVDLTTGKLKATWGGNLGNQAGKGTPGVLGLWDPDKSTTGGPTGLAPYESYLWASDHSVRVYNRFFSRRQLLEFSKDGTQAVITPIGALLPPDVNATEAPPWTLLAAPDGGLQLVDLTTGSLQWLMVEPRDDETEPLTFRPNENFTLKNPLLPALAPAEAGRVFLQAYGLSVNNVACDVLGSGGFTCHDVAEQRGFILNEFGDYWKNCPLLDAPTIVDFGAVGQGLSRTQSFIISNRGGGTLVIDAAAIQLVAGTAAGSFSFDNFGALPRYLAPGQTMSVNVTFTPKKNGISQAPLNFTSNTCSPLAVGLTGVSGARLKLSPNPISFAGVTPEIHEQTIELISVGSNTLNINSVGLTGSGAFSLSPSTVPYKALQPGQRVSFKVVFDGTAANTYAGKLVVSTNDAAQGIQEFPITASTTAKVVSAPGGFGFGAVSVGDSRKLTVTLRNKGYTAIHLQSPVLIGASDFQIDASAMAADLAPQATTTLSLSYRPTTTGTQLAWVQIDHDAPTEPPILVHAVAGTGTTFPQGFDGQLQLDVTAGGPFEGPLAPGGSLVHLAAGGFAVLTANGDELVVVTGDDKADPWYGIAGRIDLRVLFPEITGPLSSLIELGEGGFAALDRTGERIIVVHADGSRQVFFGDEGILDLGPLLPSSAVLGRGLVQTASGSLAVVDTDGDRIYAFTRDGVLDKFIANGTGVIPFRGAGAVAGGGLATGIGDVLGMLGGRFVVGDDATDTFFILSSDGLFQSQSAAAVVGNISGDLAGVDVDRFLYLDGAGVITRHTRPTLPIDATFGTEGKIDLSKVFPGATAGHGIAAVNVDLSSGTTTATTIPAQLTAVVDTAGARILVLDQDGTPFVAEPDAVVSLPSELNFGIVPAGTTSAPQSIAISNLGKLPLTVTALFDQGEFHLASTGGGIQTTVQVPPGGQTQLDVVFSPGREGQFGGTLRLTTNDVKLPLSDVVYLTGTTGGRLVVIPDSGRIEFGSVAVGDSASQSFSLQNAGADAVDVSTAVISSVPVGAFKLVAPGIEAQSIAPGAPAIVASVEFSPTKSGEAWGTITIPLADLSKPPIRIAVGGRTGPTLLVSPAQLRCEGATLGKRMLCGIVTLTNEGTAPLAIAGATVTGDGFDAITTSGVVTPGGIPLQVPVFVTAGRMGLSVGQLHIVHGGMGAQGTTIVPLTADASTPVVVTPSVLDFGAVAIGATAVRSVAVNGNAGITLLAASTTGSQAFAVVSVPPLPAPFGTGSAAVHVRCSPTAQGRFEGTLRIATDAVGQQNVEIPLHCGAGALVAASPATLAFGAVGKGQSRTLPIEVKNTGLLPIGDLTATVGTTIFKVQPFGATLSVGSSTAVFVTFSPPDNGDYADSVTLRAGGADVATVPVTGLAGPRLVAIGGTNGLDFGVQAIGTTVTRSVLVTSIGSEPVSVSTPAVGIADGAYAVAPGFQEGQLAPGESRLADVDFSPRSVGIFPDSLTFATGVGDLVVPLIGRAGGSLLVSPNNLAFGAAAAGKPVTLPLLVRNLGTQDAVVVHYFAAGDSGAFSVSGLTNGQALAPGQILDNVTVTFAPTLVGDYSATLTFYTDQGVEGGSIDVHLSGKSGPVASVVEPVSGYLGFDSVPVGSSMVRPLRIGAGGSATLSILGLSISGDVTAFNVGGLETLPRNVTPGQVADLVVVCSPPKRGRYEAELQIPTDDATHPVVRVALECRTPPAVSPSPERLTFGAVPALTASQRTVTIANHGATTLTITGLEVVATSTKAAFSLTAPFTGYISVSPGKSVAVAIDMRPTTPAEYRGVLRITGNDPARPVTEVALNGVSGPRLKFTPSIVDYCRGTGQEEILVENVGTAPAIIDGGAFKGVTATQTTVTWKGLTTVDAVSLDPGDSKTLTVSYDGQHTASDDRVNAETFVITSNDPAEPEKELRITMGDGFILPAAFNGRADIAPPEHEGPSGATPSAFPEASGLDGGFAELCTGGFVAASLADKALYYGSPIGDGGGKALTPLGAGGVTPFGAWASGILDGDLGAVVRTFPGTGIHAVLAPAAGRAYLVDLDGQLAIDAAPGGILDVSAAAGTAVFLADLAARDGTSYVALDARGHQLIGLTATGALDATFGSSGVASLDLRFPGTTDSLVGLAMVPGGSVAVLDAQKPRVVVVKNDGTVDKAFGTNNGIISLAPDGGFAEGAYGATSLAWLQPGFAVLDLPTGRVLATVASGAPNPVQGVGKSGISTITGVYGAFPATGELGAQLVITDKAIAAAEANAGKYVLPDVGRGDWMFVDSDGSRLTKGKPVLAVTGCPAIATGGTVGGTKTPEITLTNTGEGFLNVEEITTGGELTCKLGTGATDCSLGATLKPAESTKVRFPWSPIVAGCFDTQATIVHDGANGPSAICPVRLETIAEFQVTPGGDVALQNRYDYPPQAVGSSFEKEFIIRNAGCAPMPLTDISIAGATDEFVLTKGNPGTLAPGDVHKFTVACAPKSAGEHSVTVTFDVQGLAQQTSTLYCNTGPLIEVTPTNKLLVWFPANVGVGDSKTVTLRSVGGAGATITEVAGKRFRIAGATMNGKPYPADLPAAFSVATEPKSGSLPIGASADVTVVFVPPVPGLFKGRLEFTSDSHAAAAAEGVTAIALEAHSSPDVVFEPDPADFGRVPIGTKKELIVTARNIGGSIASGYAPLGVSLTGWLSLVTVGEFNLNPDPNVKKDIKLACTPTEPGVQTVTLLFDAAGDAKADGADRIGLSVTCTGGTCLDVPNDVVSFGDVLWTETDTQTVAVKNPGETDIVATISVAGEAAGEFNPGPAEVTVSAGQTVTITITFDPADAPGLRRAELHVGDPQCDVADHVVPLKAWSMPPGDGVGGDTTAGDDAGPSDDVSTGDATDGDTGGSANPDVSGGGDTSPTVTPAIEGYDGCGCDLAPRRQLPLGAALLVLAALAGWAMRRRNGA